MISTATGNAFEMIANRTDDYTRALKELDEMTDITNHSIGTMKKKIGENEQSVNLVHAAANRLTPAQRELFRSNIKLKESYEAAQNIVETFELGQKGLNRAIEENVDVEKRRQEQLKGLSSALGGASEAIGKFQAGFLPKTKVDEILGSFQQIDGWSNQDRIVGNI